MNIPVFILSTTALGVLCSLPSLGVGYWLRKKGYISLYSPFYIALLCTCVLAWIRLAAPKASLLAIACYISILFPVIYSRELWFSDRWRKWWWRRNKSEDEDKNNKKGLCPYPEFHKLFTSKVLKVFILGISRFQIRTSYRTLWAACVS